MKLPQNKRPHLKEPLGKLFKKSEEAFRYLKSSDYKQIITVGDIVSAEFLQNELNPDMIIADFKVMRSPVEENIRKTIEDYSVPKIEVENPKGHITKELWENIEKAEPPIKIIVHGEEDLATIPATLHAPEGSLVAYGQPKKGVVFVEVSKEKKSEFENLLKYFEKTKSS